MSIENALPALADILTANTDLTAYGTPPESFSELPVALLEWREGVFRHAAGDLTNDLLTAIIAVYGNRQVLPVASAATSPLITAIRDAIWDNSDLDAEALMVEELRMGEGGVGEMVYGGQTYYGFVLEADIRFKESSTFALTDRPASPSLANALSALASILEAQTGAKAHANPPESISEFPSFVLEWMTGGRLYRETETALDEDLVTAAAGLYVNRQVLPSASAVARPFLTSVRDAVWGNANLNGEVRWVPEIRFTGPGALEYGIDTHLGVVFEMDVKF
jgi:hypothetical protein